MGIRFQCPNGHKLNVKTFLAGKCGICPHCDAKFVIPNSSGSQAEAVGDVTEQAADAPRSTEELTPVAEISSGDLWYVKPAKGGEQLGPVSREEMRTWIAEDRIAPDSWVWRTGWPEWKFGNEAFDELKSPTDDASSPPSSNDLTPGVKREARASSDPGNKNLRWQSPRSRRLRAQKITVVLGVLVLLLGVVLVLVLSIQ